MLLVTSVVDEQADHIMVTLAATLRIRAFCGWLKAGGMGTFGLGLVVIAAAEDQKNSM
jgi:hypothetical protein